MPARTACSPATACRRASSTSWARRSSIAARCAAACAARPGPAPMARCPAARPSSPQSAKLNVVWGNNATVTNLHLVRRIRQSKRNGGRLVVVDPLRTKIAEQADLHLAPLPGTDVLLAWALAAELERMGAFDAAFIARHMLGFDEFMAAARAWPVARAAAACGLREEHIVTFAQWLAEADPLVFAPGNGLERGRNGGSSIRALIALPALLGKLGKRQRHRARRQQRVSQDDGAAAAARPCAAGHAHAEPARRRAASRRRRHRSAAACGVHLQPQSDRRASRSEPHAPRPGARGRVRRRHRRGDDREHGALRHRAAGGDAFRIRRSLCVVRPSLAAACRSGDPAAGESLPNTEIFRRLAARFGFDEPCFKASDADADGCGGRSRRRAAERDLHRERDADEGQGRQAAGAVRERVSRHAVGTDRAAVGNTGAALGRSRR